MSMMGRPKAKRLREVRVHGIDLYEVYFGMYRPFNYDFTKTMAAWAEDNLIIAQSHRRPADFLWAMTQFDLDKVRALNIDDLRYSATFLREEDAVFCLLRFSELAP